MQRPRSATAASASDDPAAIPRARLPQIERVSLRKQGLTIDASTWGAFRNAREKVDASKGGGGPSRLLQRGYERLLELECVPERARDAGATLGKIERIRIRW